MLKFHSKFLLFTVLFSLVNLTEVKAQEGIIVINQAPEIDTLLALKKEINKAKINYRIQIYSGNRAEAEKMRLTFLSSFSAWSTSLKYETPNYKIWVGDFETRLETDRALLQIKRKFPNAFPLKPKRKKKKL